MDIVIPPCVQEEENQKQRGPCAGGKTPGFFFCMICPLSLLVYFCDIFVAIAPEEYLALLMGLYGGRGGGGNHTWLWGLSIILN